MDVASLIENLVRGMTGEAAIAFALAAMGLNIHFGYTGLLNFGQVMYMAAGAYGLALTVSLWSQGPLWPSFLPQSWAFGVGVVVGLLVVPLVLTLIMGVPTLRLRADYLAIVTIAVSEIFRYLVRTPALEPYTGASDGITSFANSFYSRSPFDPQARYFFSLFTGNQFFIVIVGWCVVAVAACFSWLLVRSPWGRVLRAIREDEDAALSLGKNSYRFKMQALYVGGVLGAAGGLVRAISIQSVQPDNFITDATFFAWVALILGGAGRLLAPIVGASILYGVLSATDSLLRQGASNGWLPSSLVEESQTGKVRFVLVGVALILLAAFRPQGIFGSKEEMALDDR